MLKTIVEKVKTGFICISINDRFHPSLTALGFGKPLATYSIAISFLLYHSLHRYAFKWFWETLN